MHGKLLIFAVGLILPTAVAAQAPSDPQIAAIVVTANQVDIDAGRLAAEKGSHADVRAFGEMMATDHAGVNKAATGRELDGRTWDAMPSATPRWPGAMMASAK